MTHREKNPRKTRRKMQVLDYIKEVVARDGVAPSYGMIRLALGFESRSDVCVVVKRLALDGVLTIEPAAVGRMRRIRLEVQDGQAV
jgi:SOS-response transcriptional repressor LexA